jgi:hypothetical protein
MSMDWIWYTKITWSIDMAVQVLNTIWLHYNTVFDVDFAQTTRYSLSLAAHWSTHSQLWLKVKYSPMVASNLWSEKCFTIGLSFEQHDSVVQSFFISPLSYCSKVSRCCSCFSTFQGCCVGHGLHGAKREEWNRIFLVHQFKKIGPVF